MARTGSDHVAAYLYTHLPITFFDLFRIEYNLPELYKGLGYGFPTWAAVFLIWCWWSMLIMSVRVLCPRPRWVWLAWASKDEPAYCCANHKGKSDTNTYAGLVASAEARGNLGCYRLWCWLWGLSCWRGDGAGDGAWGCTWECARDCARWVRRRGWAGRWVVDAEWGRSERRPKVCPVHNVKGEWLANIPAKSLDRPWKWISISDWVA